jgi:serine/threonine-protein kinase
VTVTAVVTLTLAGSTAATGAPARVGTVVVSLVDVRTGRCLDSNGAGNVYTNPCQAPGNPYQDWIDETYLNPSDHTYQNYETGRCLDSNAAGNLYTLPCMPGDTYQIWNRANRNAIGPTFFSDTGVLFASNFTMDRCLDSNFNGNAYTLRCNYGPFEEWITNLYNL